MKVRLEITVTAKSAECVERDSPIVDIGRDPSCDLALDQGSEGVSWRHARIEFTPSGALVRDLGSTNGTFVNDQRIAGPTRVTVGDVIGIGQRGPRLRMAALEKSGAASGLAAGQPPNLRGEGISGASEGSLSGTTMAAPPLSAPPSRGPSPLQPPSDPRPTLAGVLTPLRQRQTRPSLGARLVAACRGRAYLAVLIGAALIALAVGVIAWVLLSLRGALPAS